jgi:hypothetical protein
MASQPDLTHAGDNFAATASALLRQYTHRLLKVRSELWKSLEASQESDVLKAAERVHARFQYERKAFLHHKSVYQALIRQVSQWLQHGAEPEPHLRLDMEIRLRDFEQTVRSMEEFFAEDVFQR